MTIVVGYTPSPEGAAAVRQAAREAVARSEDVVVVNVSASSDPAPTTFATEDQMQHACTVLDEAGVATTVRQLVRGKDPAEEIVGLAEEVDASLIVIGLRPRTPVGKLILGSSSQRILLDARCPVLAVKAAR